jgi:hypothetical protein
MHDPQKLASEIGERLYGVLAFQRRMNDGAVPDQIKKDHMALGFFFMLCLNLYLEVTQGQGTPVEQGTVLLFSISMALDESPDNLGPRLNPLMASPDADFEQGVELGNSVYQKLIAGDEDALMDFKNALAKRMKSGT